jgi:hypothetical protein
LPTLYSISNYLNWFVATIFSCKNIFFFRADLSNIF